MAEQSPTSHYYGIAESVPDNLLAPVGKSEAYKALREQELLCYHHLVRVLHMHDPELSKQHSRILEDLRETLNISSERGDLEVSLALADPFVTSIRTSGVAKNRLLHQDGTTDLVAEQIAAQLQQHSMTEWSEDDKRQELATIDNGFARTGSGNFSGRSAAGGSPFMPVANLTVSGSATGTASYKKQIAKNSNPPVLVAIMKEASTLQSASNDLAKKYVKMNADARQSMAKELQARIGDAELLLQKFNDLVASGEIDVGTGRATPRISNVA